MDFFWLSVSVCLLPAISVDTAKDQTNKNTNKKKFVKKKIEKIAEPQRKHKS